MRPAHHTQWRTENATRLERHRAPKLDQFRAEKLTRNLSSLHAESPRRQYADFIRANAKSIWHTNRDSGNRLGLKWVGPFDTADAARQSSAQDALNAAAAL